VAAGAAGRPEEDTVEQQSTPSHRQGRPVDPVDPVSGAAPAASAPGPTAPAGPPPPTVAPAAAAPVPPPAAPVARPRRTVGAGVTALLAGAALLVGLVTGGGGVALVGFLAGGPGHHGPSGYPGGTERELGRQGPGERGGPGRDDLPRGFDDGSSGPRGMEGGA
jgi:hypothetical protein